VRDLLLVEADVSAAFSGLLASTGLTPADIRARLIGDRPVWSSSLLYARARERGEIDFARVPPGRAGHAVRPDAARTAGPAGAAGPGVKASVLTAPHAVAAPGREKDDARINPDQATAGRR
jgi:hypothetical protein